MTSARASSTQPPQLWSETARAFVFRPVILLVLLALGISQQLSPYASTNLLFWPLFVSCVVLNLVAVPPWDGWSERNKVVVLLVMLVCGAALLGVSPASAMPVFAYFTSGIAGARLTSARSAVVIAVANAALSLVTMLVFHGGQVVQTSAFLLPLSTALPVYGGLSRRNQRVAREQAQLALIESERAAKAEAREAAAAERNRIARDVHDVVGHSLSGIAMQLDLADALAHHGRETEAQEAVRKARELAVSGMAETRRAVHALKDDVEAVAGIERLCRDVGVAFAVVGQRETLSQDASECLYRCIQESLTNARKHSRGQTSRVELVFNDGFDQAWVTLSVRTVLGGQRSVGDGAGMGVENMRLRAQALGGSAEIGPDEQGQWSVLIRIPVKTQL